MRAIRSAIRPSIRSSFGIDIVDELQALITSLFSAGEQGAFYIPQPIVNGTQSLFQDAAGKTPVTEDGDPSGLLLDQSRNFQIGDEAINSINWSNGYTTVGAKQIPTDWEEYKGANVASSTVSPNSYIFTATDHLGGIFYDILKPFYYLYTIRARKINNASGDPTLQMYSGVWNTVVPVDASVGVWYEKTFTILGYHENLIISNFTGSATWEVEYISARKIESIPAIQTISAARPTFNDSPNRLSLDKVDDALIITVPTGGWNGTMVLATDQGTASYGISIPAGAYDLGGVYFPGNAIVAALFRDGLMTTKEKADVESYFVGNGATASYGAVTSFSDFWRDWSELTSFPLIDTSAGTDFNAAWRDCTGLTSFPLIDTSAGTNFSLAWLGCTGLTSFPLIDTSSGTSFDRAWQNCSSLTSFPLIDTSSGTDFEQAWRDCSSLTSFPLIDTSSGTSFDRAWRDCSSLTSFPLIDTSAGTNFSLTWYNCTGLTSFPLIDTSAGTNFSLAWLGCSSLTSFPLIDTSSGTDFEQAWKNCTGLTSFPANAFDNVSGGNFTDAFTSTALTQTSIDNILVSLVASGISAGTRVFDQSGGSAPSSTGEAAIDTLRSRGWTVKVTGGY